MSSPEETLDTFVMEEAEILDESFYSVNPTTCLLDPIRTLFLKQCYGSFRDKILTMMNCTILAGVFTATFKGVVVRPMLKKGNSGFND